MSYEINSSMGLIKALTGVLVVLMVAIVVIGTFAINAVYDVGGKIEGDLGNRLEVNPSHVLKEVEDLKASINTQKNSAGLATLFGHTIEASDEAVAVLDTRGIIKSWSDGAVKLFGVERAAAVGYGTAFMMPEEQRGQHRSAFEEAMGSDTGIIVRVLECDVVTSVGERRMQLHVWAVPRVGAITKFVELEK